MLCHSRQALLSFSPAQRDEGLQLDEATGEVRLLCVIHAAALGLSVCPSGGLDLCSGLLFCCGSLGLALALAAVLQHGVALEGEWEPGQATAATVSFGYPAC